MQKPNPPEIFRKRLLKRAQVLAITGLSRAGLYRKIAAGTFPKPVSLADGPDSERSAVAWRLADVEAWIDGLTTKAPRQARKNAVVEEGGAA